MRRVDESPRVPRLLCACRSSNGIAEVPHRLTRSLHVTARLGPPQFQRKTSNEAISSALQCRLCKMKAPILRGIDGPLIWETIIEAALSFIKLALAVKKAKNTNNTKYTGRFVRLFWVTRASREIIPRATRHLLFASLFFPHEQHSRERVAALHIQMKLLMHPIETVPLAWF